MTRKLFRLRQMNTLLHLQMTTWIIKFVGLSEDSGVPPGEPVDCNNANAARGVMDCGAVRAASVIQLATTGRDAFQRDIKTKAVLSRSGLQPVFDGCDTREV